MKLPSITPDPTQSNWKVTIMIKILILLKVCGKQRK